MVLTNNSKGVDVKFGGKKLPGEGGFKMEFVCRRVHRAYWHSSAAWREMTLPTFRVTVSLGPHRV